jgi:chloride channel protein, CIC family
MTQGLRLSLKLPNPPLWLQQLIHSDSQLGMALLALTAGLAAALVITLFRLAIDLPLELFLPMSSGDDYESLGQWLRVGLLLAGGLLLVLLFSPRTEEGRSVGVTHVLIRMERHQGYLPHSNLILQWIAAVIALLSGHSVGREGPAIHLGAGTASQLGQMTGVAHHRLRILAAAGVASAISASFNTPMAGVIFAMEVVLLEYSTRGFIPIILASVTGAIVSRAFFGDDTAFSVPPLAMHSLLELPAVLALAFAAGCLASAFIWLVRYLQRLNKFPLWFRWGSLSCTTAAISWYLPEVMGIGYDTVNAALSGQVITGIFVLVMIAKLILVAWAAAIRFPAGLIGPVLFLGAMLGALIGRGMASLFTEQGLEVGFYVMLGMGAMMGAVLGAPLAALVALLELTANPHLIMPSMLAIVIATLVVSEGFRLPSVFEVQLGGNQLYQAPDPVLLMLRNTWVADAMSRSVVTVERLLEPRSARDLLESGADWLLLETEQILLPAAALAEALALLPVDDDHLQPTPDAIDLLAIPANREAISRISLKANLQDALDQMQARDILWLGVYRRPVTSKRGPGNCLGLVSRNMIERYYRYQPRNAR